MSIPARMRERVHSTRFLSLINRMSRLQMMLSDRRAPVKALRPTLEVELDAVKGHLSRMQDERQAYIKHQFSRSIWQHIQDSNPIFHRR